METVIIKRNGTTNIVTPAEEKNGKLYTPKGNLLVNRDKIPAERSDYIKQQLQARNITPEIEAMGIYIGDNGNGLIAQWADDVRKEAIASLTDAQRERSEISRLYAQANQAYHACDDSNIMRYHQYKSDADARLKAWEEKYPKEARKEKADNLIAEAEKKESLAEGALYYDADGLLDAEARQKRHDEIMAEAKEIRAKAKKILD
jgi:hypothetical protein